MEITDKLRVDGIAKGLCQPWQEKLSTPLGTKELIELYIKGIDFCIKNDYPTLSFIRDNFKGKCEPYGVYVDHNNIKGQNLSDIVLNGSCSGTLRYNGYSVSRIYARHETKLKIIVNGNAYLTIDAFDNSQLTLDVLGLNARVQVNVYGNAQVHHSGLGVKIKYKHKNTY